MSVLELGSATDAKTYSILSSSSLSSRHAFDVNGYDLVCQDAEALEKLRARVSHSNPFVRFSSGTIGDISERNLLSVAFFDIIILPEPFSSLRSLKSALTSVKALLKPAGRVCFVHLASPSIASSLYLQALQQIQR